MCYCVVGSMATAVAVHPSTGYYIQGPEHESDGRTVGGGGCTGGAMATM